MPFTVSLTYTLHGEEVVEGHALQVQPGTPRAAEGTFTVVAPAASESMRIQVVGEDGGRDNVKVARILTDDNSKSWTVRKGQVVDERRVR